METTIRYKLSKIVCCTHSVRVYRLCTELKFRVHVRFENGCLFNILNMVSIKERENKRLHLPIHPPISSQQQQKKSPIYFRTNKLPLLNCISLNGVHLDI